MTRAAEEVRVAFNDNFSRCVRIRDVNKPLPIQSDVYVKLSAEELKMFGETVKETNVIQLDSSQSILLKGDKHCFKFSVRSADHSTLLWAAMAEVKNLSDIVIELQPYSELQYKCFKYPYIFWPPLHTDEVKSCLGDFVSRVTKCLTALHQCGLAHLDLKRMTARQY